jgi:hypothetical protein
VSWVTSLPAGVLVAGCLAIAVALALVSRAVVRAVVAVEERDQVHAIAAPLMPALGATFAVLMALTLASEASHVRSAEDIASSEGAQGARLAWAATSDGVATDAVQDALTGYLRASRSHEWIRGTAAENEDATTARALARLERVVRAEAASTALGTPTSTELLAALDALTVARRDRLAAASSEIPTLYVVTLIASGAALIANAGALTARASVRTSVLVMGLAGVVGLSLALLFALSAPWDGPLVVSGEPIDTVVRDLRSGFFRA